MKKTFQVLVLILVGIVCSISSNSFAQQAEEASAVTQPSKIRIALFKDKGVSAGYKKDIAVIESDPAFEYELVNGQQIRDGYLDKFDIVFLPGGMASTQAKSMGPEGVQKLKDFVKSGKGYFGICAGAYFPIRQEFLNAKTKSSKWQRGSANLKIEFSELGLKLVGDKFKGEQTIYYCNGPIVDLNPKPNMPGVEVLAWFRSEVAKFGAPKGIQINSPAIVLSTYGKGTVITCSPHPEHTPAMNEVLLKLLHHLADNLHFGEQPAFVTRDENSQLLPIISAAVSYMDSMGTVEWIPENDVQWFLSSKKIMFKAGEKYKGLPYTQDARYTNLESFKELLRMDGDKPIYTGPTNSEGYRGTDCSSSCSYSWKHSIPYFPILKTGHMGPAEYYIINPETGKSVAVFKRVGDYKYANFHNSKKVIEENGREFMAKCYDQLLPGDAVVKRSHGHVCMVCRVDKANRKIFLTEQRGTNPADRSVLISDHQSWRVQYAYTYDELMDEGYLPIAVNEEILTSNLTSKLR